MLRVYREEEERNKLTDTFRVSTEDSDTSYGVLHIREQLNNAFGYIEPTAYQCDLACVRESLDNGPCPTMDGEAADVRKADSREGAFYSSGVFATETVYNLERMKIWEGT